MPKNFIAKQPVFDINLDVWGQELLFRSGEENKYVESRDQVTMDRASMSVMENTLFNQICQQGYETKCLINFTRNLLVGEYAYMLPRDSIIIEMLEDIYPDEEVIEACRCLKDAGYSIALDDFEYNDIYEELLKYVDIIKIDFMSSDRIMRRNLVERLRPYNLILLAEKVESLVDFEEAKVLGCRYFQGYYFSKPQMVVKEELYQSKLSKLKLIHEIYSQEFEVDHIERIFKTDPVLTFRLFKYINSSFFALKNDITCLRQAIVLLGEKKLKRWITVIATAALSETTPVELVRESIMRAIFCESLASSISNKAQTGDFFLLGLFSRIEAFFGRDKRILLNDLPISADIKGVLLDEIDKGHLFNTISIAKSIERGLWDIAASHAKSCGIDSDAIEATYFNSAFETKKVVEAFHS